MPETFTPKTWIDGAGGGTPIIATELNRIEVGIESMDDRTAALEAVSGVVVDAPTGVAATDQAAIAAAVSAAGTGGRLLFQAGSYVAASLTPADGQKWTGNGTTITRPSASTASIIVGTGLADFLLQGFVFDGARATSSATGNPVVSLVNCTRPRVVDCTFQNSPTANAGLIFRGTVGGVIDRCRFTNVGYGLVIGLNLGDAYSCRDNIVSNCVVNTTDLNAFFATENLASTATATTIAAASNGQTLPQGTITVASTTGFPTSGRLRLGGYLGPVVAYTGTTGTTFTGCTVVSGAGTLSTGETVNIAVQGLVQGTVFIGNTLRGYGDCGVEAGSGAVGTVISGNSFYGSSASNQSILFRDAQDSSATGNTCANNTKSTGNGIYIFNLNYITDNIALVGNVCVDNGGFGVYATGVRRILISGGTITRSGDVAVRLRNVVSYTLSGVHINRNTTTGIELGQFTTNTATDGVIAGCQIMNNNQGASANGTGIIAFMGSTGVISGCRIGDNQTTPTQVWGVALFDTTTAMDIVHNDLTGSTSGGIRNLGPSTVARVARNRGYNPQGVASVTPGASPWTYTAGITPETVYSTGGTSVSLTKNGFAVQGGVYPLEPGEQLIFTYTGAPTVRADRK